MNIHNRLVLMFATLAIFTSGMVSAAHAANGTWSNTAGGTLNWDDSGNWSSGTIADAAGFTASFTANLAADLTVNLNNPKTIGNITFTDTTSNNNNMTISGANTLTLDVSSGSPTINVTQAGRTLTISSPIAGTDGLTKSGAGQLLFTGTLSYSGTTNINAGTVVLNNDGDVTGSAVTFGGSNTGLTITGGSGVVSTWNAGGGNFGTANLTAGNGNNIQVLIDGAGTAGSAVVTNVNQLIWGRTATNSTITLTNGGQMNITGEARIGNPYYSETGGANMTIGGGTATSTFSGDGGDDFYIGYGERTGSKNNVVTVSTGGVLTSIRDMYVGHINNAQNNDNPTTNNQLLVTGGTASMRGLTLGYIQTDTKDALANVVQVTSGGQLSTTGVSYIGRANNATSTSNANTLTVTGTGSSWNAGNQIVYVGHTNNATAQSNNNILTVASGGVLTNVNSLIVGFGTGTETGNQVVLNGGSITANTLTVNAGNTLAGSGTITGAVTVNGLLSPGNSPGLITINTSLALSASSDSLFELGGMTLGTLYDNITLSGTATALTYGGDLSVLNYLTYDMDASSYTYDLFSWGAVTPSGNFASVTVNSVALSQSGSQWMGVNGLASYLFDQATGDLSITVVPEPNSLMMLAFGMISLWMFRRK